MAKLVYALDLGSSGETRESSSLSSPKPFFIMIKYNYKNLIEKELEILESNLQKNFEIYNGLIKKMLSYPITSGGKHLRPILCFLSIKMLNLPIDNNSFRIAEAVELIHSATLAHDDIIDDQDIRRNKKTLKAKYSNKVAVITGDFLLSQSLKKISEIKNNNITKLFAEMIEEICVGELNQLIQKDKIISITEYVKKSEQKTALLFLLGVKSILILNKVDTEKSKALEEYAKNFGIVYQIVNDISNFSTTGSIENMDISNGIITAPVIYASKEHSEIKSLVRSQEYKKVLDIVMDSSGIEKSRQLAEKYSSKAIDVLDIFEDNEYKESLRDLTTSILKKGL